MVKDPVCKKEIDETSAEFSTIYKNHAYYFCSGECKEKFDNTVSNLKKAGGNLPQWIASRDGWKKPDYQQQL